MAAITCPGCGTVTEVDDVRRHASEFCRTCDYPLFWAREAQLAVGDARVSEGEGLRRLPGTAGRIAVAHLTCWSCTEPNLSSATHCVRCEVDLSGPPPVEAPFVPLPPPPPPAPIEDQVPNDADAVNWPWLVAIAFVIGLIILLGVLFS